MKKENKKRLEEILYRIIEWSAVVVMSIGLFFIILKIIEMLK